MGVADTWLSGRLREAGWPLLVEHFGESVTYTPTTGDPVTCDGVLVEDETEDVRDSRGGRRFVRRGTLLVSTDSGGVANPGRPGDTVTVGGETWDVVSLNDRVRGADLAMMSVQRSETIERSRPDYRRR